MSVNRNLFLYFSSNLKIITLRNCQKILGHLKKKNLQRTSSWTRWWIRNLSNVLRDESFNSPQEAENNDVTLLCMSLFWKIIDIIEGIDLFNEDDQLLLLFNHIGIINKGDEYHSFIPHKQVGYNYNYQCDDPQFSIKESYPEIQSDILIISSSIQLISHMNIYSRGNSWYL